MSTYNGRHGPNVSQYLRDLNTISPQDTMAPEEGFNMEDDLSLFTNTQFFDFDSGQNLDYQAQPIKPDGKSAGRHSSNASDEATTAAPSVIGDMPNLDFMSGECRNISYIYLRSLRQTVLVPSPVCLSEPERQR